MAPCERSPSTTKWWALWSRIRARRAEAEKIAAYQGLPWLGEEQLLNTAGLEAVAVETQVRDLVPTARRCVAAGMHVHLDKPAGESLEEFRALLDDATRRRLTVQMGYMLRYNAGMQLCYRTGRNGWLGAIFEVRRRDEQADGRRRAQGPRRISAAARCSSWAVT